MPQAIPVVVSALTTIMSASAPVRVATFVAWGVKTAVSFGLSQLLKPKVSGSGASLGSFQRSTIATGVPRRLVVGRFGTGGVLVNWRTSGTTTNPPNKYAWLIYYLSDGPCGDLKRIFIGKEEVYNGTLSHGQTTTIRFDTANTAEIEVTYYSGTYDQTADAALVAASSTYSANHKGQGCAYVIVKYIYDEQFQTGFDELIFDFEGIKCYDRRKDTTAGGSGSHRFDDETTWEFTSNNAVIADHLMLGRYQNGVRTWGIGLDPADVPYSRFAAQANLCDETASGQQRFEANGVIESDENFQNILNELGLSMLSEAADLGGKIAFIDTQTKTSVMTITDDDIINGSVETYTPKSSWAEIPTEIGGRYLDANKAYSLTSYSDIKPSGWAAADNDVRRLSLDFRFETNQARAVRNATAYGIRARQQATISGRYHPMAIQLEKGDWFVRSGSRFPAGQTFEVIDSTFDISTFSVVIVARQVDNVLIGDIIEDLPEEPSDIAPEAVAPRIFQRSGRLNHILNGDFKIWQRGTSFTANGDYTADRWVMNLLANNFTVSRASPVGLPFEYALRADLTAMGNNHALIQQKVDNIYALSGREVVLSFWARSNETKEIQCALRMRYGSGGSATVALTSPKIEIDTNWARYFTTFDTTSLSGKTVGAGHHVETQFRLNYADDWLAGDWFELAGVQMELGSVPTEFEHTHEYEQLAQVRHFFRIYDSQQATADLAYEMYSTPTESGSGPYEYEAEI